MAFGYTRTDYDIDESGGNLDSELYDVSIYGSYYVSDKFYIEGIASFGWNDYDTDRSIIYSIPSMITRDPGGGTIITTNINQTAKGTPDGTQLSLSIGSGYDFNIDEFAFGPYGRVNYVEAHIDGFQEEIDNTGPGNQLNLDIDGQDVETLTTVLGFQVSFTISTRWAVLTPQTRLEWEHEYENDERNIDARFVNDPSGTTFSVRTDSPDRNFFNTGVGIAATFTGGRSAFIYYETILGLDDVTSHNIEFGVRF